MSTIKDFERLVTRRKISVPGYGDIWICNNQKQECGTCLGNWNYVHELPYITEANKLLNTNSIGIDVGAHTGTYFIALKNKIKAITR